MYKAYTTCSDMDSYYTNCSRQKKKPFSITTAGIITLIHISYYFFNIIYFWSLQESMKWFFQYNPSDQRGTNLGNHLSMSMYSRRPIDPR